jgi:formylglycine-generating enzyme required for sulfatase activity
MTTSFITAQTPLEIKPIGNGETLAGPPSAAQRDAWLAAMRAWRDAERTKLKFDDSLYARPELAWAQRTFVQPQMMCEDRYFYDPVARRYTVDRYLDDLEARYGGIDSVLIWPVYSNVGIDNRNQHDMLRAMPGGLAGVRAMVQDFHRRGVRVLFPMMPWEAGTRQEGVTLAQAVARDFAEAGIDGVNGDTMRGIPKEFLDACQARNHLLVFEPELEIPLEDVQWDVLGWGYWPYPPEPVVDTYKWLESRHRTHVCDRWAKDHTHNLQAAFFNGDGFESWENVWGIWNGITPRDAEALRRVATVERGLADFLVSPDWEPHVLTLQPGVYASMFPTKDGTVWLVINTSDQDLDGDQLAVEAKPGAVFYDVWHGVKLNPEIEGRRATLPFAIEAKGFGAVLMRDDGPPPPDIRTLLEKMAALTQQPLASFSSEWKVLPQIIVDIARTAPASSVPGGMVAIPAAKYHFQVKGVEIEGWGDTEKSDQTGVDVQYPWEAVPTRAHAHDVDIPAFYMDQFPVTNAQFKAFLDATKYHPADDYNFLKDWTNGTFPDGWAKKPVTWVSLEDARAYAAWAGKRLPHEWEWQYAAQGTDGRAYPWGATPDASAIPTPVTGHDLTGPADVDAHPKGASPFGVMDLTGNIWQWTDEFQDEHTRAAIVRGDCYYHPQGSKWYFPRNPTLDVHGKYLLMCPGKDRAGTLGFRCVKDAG